jgi:hypothetical protein
MLNLIQHHNNMQNPISFAPPWRMKPVQGDKRTVAIGIYRILVSIITDSKIPITARMHVVISIANIIISWLLL